MNSKAFEGKASPVSETAIAQEAFFHLGLKAVSAGDAETALKHFHAQLEETPDHYEARLHLAKAFKRLKRMEDATAAFTAILHKTSAAEPALELSRIALHNTDYDTAEEMIRLALARDPGQSQIKSQSEAIQKARQEHAFRLGVRAASAGDTETALKHFHAQLEETPDHYEARLHLAKAFKRLKRMEDAAAAFTAILHKTSSAEPALELSRIALHNTDYDTAEEMIRLAL
ncbi:MAG: tetratricopeptide repeat protein, partial [Chloroflexi bacterium]|nr:tetratricopeptide repeat protein [Chloroflexota bacterium]